MKPDKLLLELETLLEKHGFHVRKERGNFKGANCILEGSKLVIINKNNPIDTHLATMAKVLSEIDFSDTYIKPAVSKELDALWGRLKLTPKSNRQDWGLTS